MDVKWIKITTNVFDDEKILLIESLPDADSIIVIWFKLLTLAGKMNNGGVFLLNDRIAYTDEMLATIFRRNVNTVRLALKTFSEFGMIEIVDKVISIPNWSKHQSLDASEHKKEYMRKYMQARREKERLECKTNCKANSKSNVSSLDKNREEEEGEVEVEKKNKKENQTLLQKPDGVSDELFDEWKAHKKRVSKSCTQRMVNHLVAEAQKAGLTPARAMEIQLEHGWTGFEATYVQKTQETRSVPVHKDTSIKFDDDYYAKVDPNNPWGI